MRTEIEKFITDYVKSYVEREEITTEWRTPIVSFAAADSEYIQKLPQTIDPSHALPKDVLPEAKTIIAYFVPFTETLTKGNRNVDAKTEEGWELASGDWARAYEETNGMFAELNEALVKYLQSKGVKAAAPVQATTFDKKKLISSWSHRHIAYAAGLGTFGVNNMLITKKGCSGRFYTIVTDLDMETDDIMDTEMCTYRRNGGCGVCAKNCPTGALKLANRTVDFDREKCFALCYKNSLVHNEFGNSYDDGDGNANSEGSEVCGKCIAASPCAYWDK